MLPLTLIVVGCVAQEKISAKPYDNPTKGYVVYTPEAGYQRWDGIYLKGFHSTGLQYLDNCVASGSLTPAKRLQGYLRYDEKDGVVYLAYNGGPSMARCDINYDIIRAEVEQHIGRQKSVAEAKAIESNRKREQAEQRRADNPKAAATEDSIELFVKYCELLKDATGNASHIDDLRAMRHDYVGPVTNAITYRYSLNLFRNTGGNVYCQAVVPQFKEQLYSLGIDPTQ